VPTAGATAVNGGDEWFNDVDMEMGIVMVAGCSYPNVWDAMAVQVLMALCTGTPRQKVGLTKRTSEPWYHISVAVIVNLFLPIPCIKRCLSD
jgi:hypothetical protein